MTKLSNALDRFDSGLERYFSKKRHWFITIPVLILLVLGLYLIFCFSNARYNYTSYGYRSEGWRTAARVIGGIVICVSIIYLFLEGFLRKLTARKAVWAFMVIASTFLTLWGFQHALNLDHHHDAGAMGGGNHWSIIYDIYSKGEIPAVNLHNQYYQPKLYHATIAMLMKFNMLFVNVGNAPLSVNYPAYTLSAYHALEMTRVFMILLGIASFYSIYRIIAGLGFKGKKLAVITALLILIPEFWYIQFFMNNDGMALTLCLAALALAVEFLKKENVLVLAFSAICLGLSMMTKLNSALMAVPIAGLFLYVFIRKIREKNAKNTWVLIGKFAIFAVLVFPIGLFTPIYYKIKYDMPIGYVLDLCPTLADKEAYGMYIDPAFYNFFERCIAFPNQDLFYSPFNYRWREKINGVYVNAYGRIDFNCWTAFFKTGFFNEWDDFFRNQGHLVGALLVVGLYLEVFLAFFAIFATLYYVIAYFLKKKWRGGNIAKPMTLALIGLAFAINYIYFVNKYPVGCSQNARYVMPLFIPIQSVIGSMLCDGIDFAKARRQRLPEPEIPQE